MSNVIVISSDEEDDIKKDDNDVVFLKEIHGHDGAENIPNNTVKKDRIQVLDLTSPPSGGESNFRISRLKLNALKLGTKRHILHSKIETENIDACGRGTDNCQNCDQPTPSKPKYLKIDPTRWKELKAIVEIQLESLTSKSLKIKKENLSGERDQQPRGILSPRKNKETVYTSPQKSQSTKKNLLQFLKSSPRSKNLENVFDKMSLSPTKTPSPKTTPVKTQSTLETWATPMKKMKKQAPVTPKCDVMQKRNDVVWPPDHVILNTEEFIKRLYKTSREFPTTYNYLLESLQDEQLFFNVVQSIDSFMSTNSAPSAELLWYLVNDVLSSSSDSSHISLTYTLLNEILERYPGKCIGMKITWQDIKKYFFLNEVINDKKSCKRKSSYKLVASFLLSVLSVELKAGALKSKQRRMTKHFSVDFDVRHVKDVIPCLQECLQDHTAASNDCGAAEGGNLPGATSICGLQQFQNLLKLFMIVSVHKENAALRLANELMYLYIDVTNLQERVLLLQTIMSHLVREHLIKVLLMNYCSLLPEALQDRDLPLSVKRVILQDFYREPPKRSGKCGHSVEDVEEYVTLLAYLLQSYVIIHSPRLHGYHNDNPLCDHDDVKRFSQEDLSYLKDLKFYVSRLRKRCRSFLDDEQRLSLRTTLLLHMMEII